MTVQEAIECGAANAKEAGGPGFVPGCLVERSLNGGGGELDPMRLGGTAGGRVSEGVPVLCV